MLLLDKNSKKKVYQVLLNTTGLNTSTTVFICNKFGFQKNCTLKDLDNSDLDSLKNYLLGNFYLNNFLTEKVNKNVKKKIDIGIYEGKRHNLGYPVRGQRTLSNAKTQKKLHRFRFYYDSKFFNHNFFKNQRKSKKKTKLVKIQEKKKKNLKT